MYLDLQSYWYCLTCLKKCHTARFSFLLGTVMSFSFHYPVISEGLDFITKDLEYGSDETAGATSQFVNPLRPCTAPSPGPLCCGYKREPGCFYHCCNCGLTKRRWTPADPCCRTCSVKVNLTESGIWLSAWEIVFWLLCTENDFEFFFVFSSSNSSLKLYISQSNKYYN